MFTRSFKVQQLVLVVPLVLMLSCHSRKSPPSSAAQTISDSITNSASPPMDEYLTTKGFELMDSEHLGEIKRGLTEDQLTSWYGKPDSVSEQLFSEGDGQTYVNVKYMARGIFISYVLREDSTRVVSVIEMISPGELKTSKNIGLGSPYTEVQQAYERFINPIGSGPDCLVVGSIYGGLIFNFVDQKVSRIYIGAAAE